MQAPDFQMMALTASKGYSLLHIKAVAIFDHALKAWLCEKGLTVPKKPYGTDLKGRIDFLTGQKHLNDASMLHRLRSVRNDLAHEPKGTITWQNLKEDIATINEAMKELKLVDDIPSLEIHAERSAAEESPDPNVNCIWHYKIAVKEADRVVAEIAWSQRLLNDDE